jgi:hypothetical protein
MDTSKFVDTAKGKDSTSAGPRKAVLWGREDLLAQAVGLFLEAERVWDVNRVSSDGGVDHLIEEVKRTSPDVVILCQERVDEESSLPVRLIQEQLCLKVITVGLESNLMQVHSKHSVIVRGVSDLLSIVESGYFPKNAQEKEVRHS